jgi:hypothetical protein
MSEDARHEAAVRIQREIEMLRARARTSEAVEELQRANGNDGDDERHATARGADVAAEGGEVAG